MSGFTEPEIAWSQDQMIEVTLNEPDDFLKVRETLTRIGVASRKEKKIYQKLETLSRNLIYKHSRKKPLTNISIVHI